MSSKAFWKWFHEERDKRGLSINVVEKMGGVSKSSISARARYELPPTYDNCRAIAKAFGIPLEDVLRKAGLLPPRYEDNPSARELLYRFSQLSEEEQEYILLTAEALIERKRKREAQKREKGKESPAVRPADGSA